MNRRLTIGISAAAGAVVALLGFGIAGAAPFATIPPNTLHGCVDTAHNRALNRVFANPTSGTTCPSGQFQVIWPSGADNDPTPQAVTAGTGGLDVTVASQTGAPSCTGTPGGALCQPHQSVTCPSDHPYVLGGGGDASGFTLGQSDPIPGAPGGWIVRTYIASQTDPTPSVMDVYAICAK
jgi:hypothetical protein